MIGVGIDVGHSTGIVVATICRGETPSLITKSTLHYLEPELSQKFFLLLPPNSLIRCVVEYPLNDRRASGNAETQKARKKWEAMLSARFPPSVIYHVSPSDWKPSASGQIPFIVLIKGKKITLTKHEQDAYRMLHWFSCVSNLLGKSF